MSFAHDISSFIQRLPGDLRKLVLAHVPAHGATPKALVDWRVRFGSVGNGCVICKEPSNGGSVWVGPRPYRYGHRIQTCRICASCFLLRPVVYVADGRGMFRHVRRGMEPIRNARIRVPGHGLVECYELEMGNLVRVVIYPDQTWEVKTR